MPCRDLFFTETTDRSNTVDAVVAVDASDSIPSDLHDEEPTEQQENCGEVRLYQSVIQLGRGMNTYHNLWQGITEEHVVQLFERGYPDAT